MSKGSWQRPCNKKRFDENYDRIFGDNKDVDGKPVEAKDDGRTVDNEEVEPYESSDPVLRSIEADNR
jgi:hypothetical protein